MSQEIEVKIKITSEQLGVLQKWLDANAKFAGQIYHKEYYLDNPNSSYFFTNAQGKKDALRFLRVRLTESGDSACYKKWYVDEKTGNTTHCDEIEVKLVDGLQTLKLLQAAGFSDAKIKEKTRKKYLFDGFEIAIDDIRGEVFNGVFVEVEIDPAYYKIDDVGVGIQKIYALLREIGIFVFEKQVAGNGKMETVRL